MVEPDEPPPGVGLAWMPPKREVQVRMSEMEVNLMMAVRE